MSEDWPPEWCGCEEPSFLCYFSILLEVYAAADAGPEGFIPPGRLTLDTLCRIAYHHKHGFVTGDTALAFIKAGPGGGLPGTFLLFERDDETGLYDTEGGFEGTPEGLAEAARAWEERNARTD